MNACSGAATSRGVGKTGRLRLSTTASPPVGEPAAALNDFYAHATQEAPDLVDANKIPSSRCEAGSPDPVTTLP
jgi:hypothetical protein